MRILFVLWLLAAEAWGCTCAVSPAGDPPCQSAWRYDAVFTGLVTEITDPGFPTVSPGRLPEGPLAYPQKKVRIRITEMLRGLEPDQKEIVIETGLGGGDCGYDFRRGFDYIVYASKKPGGGLSASICTPTRLVENAAEDLKYFHQLGQASPVAEIRVMAWDVHGARVNMRELPVLAGAHVTVDGPANESATTVPGRCLSNLPPGGCTTEWTLEGYTIPSPLRPVRVHSKGCAEVALPLQLDRVVSGRILGKDGRPAAGVIVEAVPRRPRYENELPFSADSSTTDETGRYELRPLPPATTISGSHSAAATYRIPIHAGFIRARRPGRCSVGTCPINPDSAVRPDGPGPAARSCHWRYRLLARWPAPRVNIFLEDPRWPAEFHRRSHDGQAGPLRRPRFGWHSLPPPRSDFCERSCFGGASTDRVRRLFARPETRSHPERVFSTRWLHQQSTGRLAQGPRPALSRMMIT